MSLEQLKTEAVYHAKVHSERRDDPLLVVSPYRFNPLGAHIDHQGGLVLARTMDQYTLLPFWPDSSSRRIRLSAQPDWTNPTTAFLPGDVESINKQGTTTSWTRYAKAAAASLNRQRKMHAGLCGYVTGTLVGAGLSSSASVVLAYLFALANANSMELLDTEYVELSRQVENDYLGLNNGVMDQMSIVTGRAGAMSCIDSRALHTSYVDDPTTADEVSWVICYSGVSRQLVGSGYNTRVDECRKAARSLDPEAHVLADVDSTGFADEPIKFLSALSTPLASRARHFFTETQRVDAGRIAWRDGDYQRFGTLMNQSCHSSITNYECGSQPLIDLHETCSSLSGVFGSRFGGGGYGGCLIMLTDTKRAISICEEVIEHYHSAYPQYKQARAFIAKPESCVRIETTS